MTNPHMLQAALAGQPAPPCEQVSAAVEVVDAAPSIAGAAELADQINAAVRDAQGHASAAVSAALRAGGLLTRAKGRVQHGQWEAWIELNCPAVSLRTAQAYMRLHAKFPALPELEAQRVALLPLRQAMAAITAADQPMPRKYEKSSRDCGATRPLFEAALRSLRSVAGDVGVHKITVDRIRTLRERLGAVAKELGRMEAAAK